MIKRILVPTNGGDAAARGVSYAVALASRFKAHVIGLNVVDVRLVESPFVRDIATGTGTPPFLNYPDGIAAVLEDRGRVALAALEVECAGSGVTCETSLAAGVVPLVIVEQAELTDLVVLGRITHHGARVEEFVGSTTESVARHASVPVLVTGAAEPSGGCCLAAYDGSAHARNALRTAVEVAAEWQMPLRLLVVSDEPQPLLDEARSYLQSHELHVEYETRTGKPGEQIAAHAADCGATLIIMGAFGHTKLRELIVGSTTAQTLHRAPCPVLLIR